MAAPRLALLALIALAAGCGHPLPVEAPAAATGDLAVFKAGGQAHLLGYDADGYQSTHAKRPQKTTPARQGMLPGRVDLRDQLQPIYSQGLLGSCTAFALAKGLREYLARTDEKRPTELSALWFYYEERAQHGPKHIKKQGGIMLADGMRVLETKGCATEASWPYVPTLFTQKPPDAAYDSATAWKIKGWQELTGLDEVKASLAAGKPVAFGFYIYTSFTGVGGDGIMPMPADGEARMGGHAVLAVGYDDAKQQLIIRNSWGPHWADQGYFYMPYAFAADPKRAMEWVTVK